MICVRLREHPLAAPIQEVPVRRSSCLPGPSLFLLLKDCTTFQVWHDFLEKQEDGVGAPLIAVVGSADPQRTYDPELKDAEKTRRAAEELGHELAVAGCRIMVYSGDPKFIEAHIVRGYVASGKACDGSIEVRFPDGSKAASFPEHQSHPSAFRFHPDTSRDWEVSFYRSLADADGVLGASQVRAALARPGRVVLFDVIRLRPDHRRPRRSRLLAPLSRRAFGRVPLPPRRLAARLVVTRRRHRGVAAVPRDHPLQPGDPGPQLRDRPVPGSATSTTPGRRRHIGHKPPSSEPTGRNQTDTPSQLRKKSPASQQPPSVTETTRQAAWAECLGFAE
jgi:hypothetical protein